MQSYPFEFAGQQYELCRIDRNVKDYVCDRLSAQRMNSLTRQMQEKLIDEKTYAIAKGSTFVRWNSAEFANDIMVPENMMLLIRRLLKDGDKIDDETLNAMAESESFLAAFELCREDSEPKKAKGA